MAARAYHAPGRDHYDVIIVGGAVIGSAVAYWLSQNPDFHGSILVVERDSSYEFSSTALSTSAIRQQFSNPINIKISQFGVQFIHEFQQRMQVYYPDTAAPDLSFLEYGYLYCIPPENVETAKKQVTLQRSLGAHTVFFDQAALKDKFPWLNVADLGGGCWGSKEEGWFDSFGLLQGFRKAARHNGAEYIDNEVVALDVDDQGVRGITLDTGEHVACATLVNAAGPRAGVVARMAGLVIPVEPRKRHSFVFASATPIPGQMPNVINTDGTFVRPEHDLFLTGNTPTPDERADVDDFQTKHDEFYDYIWPSLYQRIPQFEALKVKQAWTGHYAFNTLDHNAIVGRHPRISNFIFANGFSGHGLQQSPAVGRGVMELITYGRYQTLDLSPFQYERTERNEPFLEEAVI